MSVTGLVISLILVIIVLVWILLPFASRVKQASQNANSVTRQRERMQLYYERVLRNIHDLDEDRATGKLNEDEYTADRAMWVKRGVEVLKALDNLDAKNLIAPTEADDARIDEAIDRTIEMAMDSYQDQAEST